MVRLSCPPFKWRETGSVDISQMGKEEISQPAVPEEMPQIDQRRATIRFIVDVDVTNVPDGNTINENDEINLPKNQANNNSLPNNNYKRPTDDIVEKRPEIKKRNKDAVSMFIQTQEENQDDQKKRREGVLVSGIDSSKPLKEINYERFQKDDRSYKLIRDALIANDFINNLLDEERLNAVVEAMHPEEHKQDSFIIREGETGSHLFVSDTGSFEVIKGAKTVKKFGSGEAFGELAVLYKAKRFASIKASTDVKIWVLERRVFQKIMVRSGKQEQEDNLKFLSSVPVLDGIHQNDLIKISNFLRREFFAAGTMIVKQGEKGDKFYIIRGGTVVITQRSGDGGPDKFIKELSRGDYFGEQALLHEDRRLATVTAKAPGVECLTMERGPFNENLGNIGELRKRYRTSSMPLPKRDVVEEPKEYRHIQLTDLEIVGTLGVGAFGRVELVQYNKDKSLTFALKCLKKVDVVLQQQQEHAFNEKNIMYRCNNPFVCKLYKTYKDNKYLYFLMEPILGGDVWTILQKKKLFDDKTARFMTACVIEAFEHLHNQGIVYRDLKPENLMIDAKGYVKLVDFGYAKYLSSDVKTYTFAGTPEYVAPEVILGQGHDRAVDYWALGIFIHELLIGKPPFRGTNHVKTYNLIIRGIDAIEFSPRISKVAQVLIKKLCRSLPMERLGYLKNGIKDVKNHKWFLGFDWEKLRDLKMQAPLIRPIANNKDLSNFDKYEKENVPPDENSGWDQDF